MKIKVDKYTEAVLQECYEALISCRLETHYPDGMVKEYNRYKVEKALQSLKSVL